MPINLKRKEYEACILPVSTYGLVTTTNKEERSVNIIKNVGDNSKIESTKWDHSTKKSSIL